MTPNLFFFYFFTLFLIKQFSKRILLEREAIMLVNPEENCKRHQDTFQFPLKPIRTMTRRAVGSIHGLIPNRSSTHYHFSMLPLNQLKSVEQSHTHHYGRVSDRGGLGLTNNVHSTGLLPELNKLRELLSTNLNTLKRHKGSHFSPSMSLVSQKTDGTSAGVIFSTKI